MDHNQTIVCQPPNLGWLEEKITDNVTNYLWKCIDNKGKKINKRLAGVIHESNALNDEDNWFFDNVLLRLCCNYNYNFGDIGMIGDPHSQKKYYLREMWVNFQKENEFNPMHLHYGIFSFVIWMKIPTYHEEQNKNSKSVDNLISAFEFNYCNILGERSKYLYKMNPEIEGTIIFFPSKLYHCVYPFYDCDQDRISISGNISEKFINKDGRP